MSTVRGASGPSLKLRGEVYRRVEELVEIARSKRCPNMSMPTIGYYTGRNAAGLAHLETNVVKFHTILLEENREQMLRETVAHEMAHLAVHDMAERFIVPRKEGRAHGNAWKRVMLDWYGVPCDRRHNFDMTNAGSKRQRKWAYTCECDSYEISTTRHYRILRGRSYHCRKCSATIKRATT